MTVLVNSSMLRISGAHWLPGLRRATVAVSVLAMLVATDAACGFWLSKPGQSLAWAVGTDAGVGVVAAMVVGFGPDLGLRVPRWVGRVLALGVAELAFAACAWILPSLRVAAILASILVALGGLGVWFWLAGWRIDSPADLSRAWWPVVAVGLLCPVLASITAASVPSAPSWRFRPDERVLDRAVRALVAAPESATFKRCFPSLGLTDLPVLGQADGYCRLVQHDSKGQISAALVEFTNPSGWGYAYSLGHHDASLGDCILHLDGPWWEVAPGDGTAGCPLGYRSTFTPSG